MNIVKILGMIFLAVYLIISGLTDLSGTAFMPIARNCVDFLALVAGVLIFVSLGRFFPNNHHKR